MRFLTMRSLPRLPMWGRCGALIYNGVWIVHGLPYWRTRRGALAPLLFGGDGKGKAVYLLATAAKTK